MMFATPEYTYKMFVQSKESIGLFGNLVLAPCVKGQPPRVHWYI